MFEIEIPDDLVEIAKNTKPEGISIEDWILEWTRFGLDVSQKASSRKEAIEIGANISESAIAKFGELVGNLEGKVGTGEGQLLEEVGKQIGDYEKRLEELESLTDLNEKEKGFGKVFEEMLAFVDPNNTESAIYQYQQLLKEVDDENGLVRRAIRSELAKDRGLNEQIDKILTEMNIESGRQQIRRKTAVKGGSFEDTLVGVLEELVGSNEIMFRKLGKTGGALSKNSGHFTKGDIKIDFGRNHVLHGSGIVIEAKNDMSFHPVNPKRPEVSAEFYLEKAIANRECSVGIWVQNKTTAKHFDRDFSVQGNTIFVVWDEEDPGTDWLLLAAIYIAMGRVRIGSDDLDEEERFAISDLIEKLKQEVERFGRMTKWIGNVKTNVKLLDEEIAVGTIRIRECLDGANDILNMSDEEYDSPDIEFENSDSKASSEEE